jgi:hypothetical protein
MLSSRLKKRKEIAVIVETANNEARIVLGLYGIIMVYPKLGNGEFIIAILYRFCGMHRLI